MNDVFKSEFIQIIDIYRTQKSSITIYARKHLHLHVRIDDNFNSNQYRKILLALSYKTNTFFYNYNHLLYFLHYTVLFENPPPLIIPSLLCSRLSASIFQQSSKPHWNFLFFPFRLLLSFLV